jgi:hypothetical protein
MYDLSKSIRWRFLEPFLFKNMIIRRCCWNNCGEDGLSIYEGRLTYFCSEDICNGDTSDQYLIQGGNRRKWR